MLWRFTLRWVSHASSPAFSSEWFSPHAFFFSRHVFTQIFCLLISRWARFGCYRCCGLWGGCICLEVGGGTGQHTQGRAQLCGGSSLQLQRVWKVGVETDLGFCQESCFHAGHKHFCQQSSCVISRLRKHRYTTAYLKHEGGSKMHLGVWSFQNVGSFPTPQGLNHFFMTEESRCALSACLSCGWNQRRCLQRVLTKSLRDRFWGWVFSKP